MLYLRLERDLPAGTGRTPDETPSRMMTTTSPKTHDGQARMRRGLGFAIAVAAIVALGIATALHQGGEATGAGEHGATETGAETAAPVADSAGEVPAGETDRQWVDRVLMGGPGAARAVAMSPDGNRVLAVRERGVDLWTVHGRRTGWLAIDGDRVDGASWSSDGRRVIVWGGQTVRLWNAETGSMIATLQAGMGPVVHAELLPDGTHAVTLGKDGTRRTWDLTSGAIEKIERDVTDASGGKSAIDDDATTAHVYVDERGDVRMRESL
jgi:hypothetical protein